MFGLAPYDIDLKALKDKELRLDFAIGDDFFEGVGATLLHKGRLNVGLTILKVADFFELKFHIEGVVTVTCDLCLDDMEQEVCSDDVLTVKLGEEYEEDDDLVTVPADKGTINVAWHIYEFIALCVPVRHVHAPGKCNDAMTRILSEHSAARSSEATDEDIDPRWNKLKELTLKIKDNGTS